MAKHVAFLTPGQTDVRSLRNGVPGTTGKSIVVLATFKLIDANGGGLADGDGGKISHSTGTVLLHIY